MDYSNFKITNIEAKANNDLKTKTNPTAIFMGSNILTKNADQILTMKTNSYEKVITNQITSTVTRGISISLKTKIFIFNSNLNFEYNETTTNTEEKTIRIVSPNQSFKIPPHNKYKITVYSGQNISKISLNLNANISGNINCIINFNGTWNQFFSIDMLTALLFLPSLPKGISLDFQNNQIIFNGVAIAKNFAANNNFSVKTEKLPLN